MHSLISYTKRLQTCVPTDQLLRPTNRCAVMNNARFLRKFPWIVKFLLKTTLILQQHRGHSATPTENSSSQTAEPLCKNTGTSKMLQVRYSYTYRMAPESSTSLSRRLVTRGPDIQAKGIVVVRRATVRPYLYSISADANETILTNRREVVSNVMSS